MCFVVLFVIFQQIHSGTLLQHLDEQLKRPIIRKVLRLISYCSPLRVNEGLRQLETWNEDTIKERAEKLAKKALDVWPAPP